MKNIKSKFYSFILLTSLVIFSIILSKILLKFNLLISSTFICILLGLIVGNVFKISKNYSWFIDFSLKKLLRVGIGFLGIGLSITELINYGSKSLFLVVLNIIIVFIILYYLCRIFSISNKFGHLITMGTSICGVTAVIATSSIIKSSKNETSYAVGVITLFGMTSVFLYPYLANYLFITKSDLAGIFLGTSIHDTAQVSAAAMIYFENYDSEIAMNSAMTTKLLRNSFLIFLIPLIAYLYNVKENSNLKNSIKDFFPFFVLGFIILSIIRSLGDQFILDSNHMIFWNQFIIYTKYISKYLILNAMVSLGLQTNLKNIVKLGFKPLLVGFLAAISVGISSLVFLQTFI